MTPPDYRKIFPEKGETPDAYCGRLQDGGYEEMYIRKALAVHFDFTVDVFADFFEDFEVARLRHITMLRRMFPTMIPYAFHKKVSKNLGLTSEKGHYWIKKFDEAGEVDYRGDYEKSENGNPET